MVRLAGYHHILHDQYLYRYIYVRICTEISLQVLKYMYMYMYIAYPEHHVKCMYMYMYITASKECPLFFNFICWTY